jgi:Na+-transporting methylmalonyl-CoA/oxaloacetate decarboxylase gamma subunit
VIASLLNSPQGCGKISGARATASSIYETLACCPQQSFFHKHNHRTTLTQVRDIHPHPLLLYSLQPPSPFSNSKSSDNECAHFFSTLFLLVVVVSAGSLSDRRPFGHPKSSDNRASVFSPLVRRHRLAVITAKVRIAEIGQQPRFRPQEHCSEKHSAKDHSLYLHQNSLVKVVLSFGYVFDIVLLSKNV